ncbi:MAG: radical SAM protein [Candidatus Gracilibacteria bacterium]|nr:radical SAM protein [Candidatus Gracilibacteria bacterium]MDD2908600.1 radical SAM protein [Candidatus Gracilibacteria bacterium]
MTTKDGNAEKIYINEIIRVTYKCNWSCKFCNVLKTNNFGEYDVSKKEIIYQILNLTRKYTLKQRENLILSFSGGEPTLDNKLFGYIKLAKKIGVGVVEIQTNGTRLFNKKKYILDLIEAGLNEIFLAQHSGDENINKELGIFYKIEDFLEWTKFILENNIHKKISIYLNIVVTKINIFHIYDYILLLLRIGFINVIADRFMDDGKITHKISFGFVQPNGYAELNKEEVLLKYTESEIIEVDRIVNLCKDNNILPDFHFVCPPLCIINYPEYNLEYERLKKLEQNKIDGNINKSNLESYEFLWKEKHKLEECNKCIYNNYCLGFYKNWIEFIGEENVRDKIAKFLN